MTKEKIEMKTRLELAVGANFANRTRGSRVNVEEGRAGKESSTATSAKIEEGNKGP